jgi:hypothetical protein
MRINLSSVPSILFYMEYRNQKSNSQKRIFDGKSKLQEDTFTYSYANFQPYSMK